MIAKYEGFGLKNKDKNKWYNCKKCGALYCSKHCQKVDWNKYNHKFQCDRLSKYFKHSK